jgi:hypothetical protein
MPVVKETFYGHVRRTAFNLWRGPDYVENSEMEDVANFLGGVRVLRLAIRKGETAKPLIEARSVYANLNPNEPQDAVLRSMYWDNTAIRHTTHSTPLDTPFTISAKFVRLPLASLLQWIHSLENIPTTIQTTSQEDYTLPICTLEVATSGILSVFEKTWQVVEGENAELNRVWQDIWRQMEQVLQTSPSLTDIKESFHCIEVKPDVYDLQAYQPTLNVL